MFCFNPLAGIPCGQLVSYEPVDAQFVSIPLRGFHVDNSPWRWKAETDTCFNPLAGIPCGQQFERRRLDYEGSFNPLAGIPCGQRIVGWFPMGTVAFQSPCGDSMWTTTPKGWSRITRRRFNPLAGIPCGQPVLDKNVSQDRGFQSPCGDSMWTTTNPLQ